MPVLVHALPMDLLRQLASHMAAFPDFGKIEDIQETPEQQHQMRDIQENHSGFTFDQPLQELAADYATSQGGIPKKFTSQGTTPSGKPRLFVCGMCTRAFARLEHLRRHERLHTKEKPFDCGVCQRKFSRRDLLLRHAQKLHAGCDDAVARMRRKLLKVQANTTTSASSEPALGSALSGVRSAGSNRTDLSKSGSFQNSDRSAGIHDVINFNLNSFAGISAHSKDLLHSPATPQRMSRLNSSSAKEPSLKKLLYDKRKPHFRRASFSAQSGTNYAMVPPPPQDASSVENVEFLTPQFLPSFTSDEELWLNNLCTIPGMLRLHAPGQITELSSSYSFESEFPRNAPLFGGNMHPHLVRSDSMTSGSMGLDGANPPYSAHKPSFTSNMSAPLNSDNTYHVKSEIDTGYSFYDIPESLASRGNLNTGTHRPLSPIRQELEDELMDLDNMGHFRKTSASDKQFSNINELDELGQLFDEGGNKLLGGYSFYGDNPLLPSTGLESMSSHASASPSNMASANPQHLARAPYQNGKHFEFSIEEQLKGTSLFDLGFSRTVLFTNRMRLLIKKALSKYPLSDIPSPNIPSNEKLESYLKLFVERLLPHVPFIHPSKLNEFDVMDMTSNEDPENESARICLPLLVATMGALLGNSKTELDWLHEASRRAIHIYLESRKSGNTGSVNSSSAQHNNPLWLIQSLTLSVIYGLFSDSQNNVYIVIRQLNALNSLVKISIKKNPDTLFTVNGQDNLVQLFCAEGNFQGAMDATSNPSEDEVKFKYAILKQSQARTALVIYQLTNFIFMMYNVPLTLSAPELGSLTCPNTHDEFLWEFNSYKEVLTHMQSMGIQRDINFFLFKDETNTIVFYDILQRLCQSQVDTSISSKLMNLSRFGYNCLVKGIYELMQYEDYRFMETSVVLNYLALFIDSPARNAHTHYLTMGKTTGEKIDFAILVNFVKISSIVDFKMVKEQSWLKQYDDLTKNFREVLKAMETISDVNCCTMIDCGVAITKLVMFKTVPSELREEDATHGMFLEQGSSSVMDYNTQNALNERGEGLEMYAGLKSLDEIYCTNTPILSQVLFHIFVLFSGFAIHIAKRNNQSGSNLNSPEMWQLNEKFMSILRLISSFERHIRAQVDNHELHAEMTNMILFSSGNSNNLFADHHDGQESHEATNNAFVYSLDKAVHILRVGETMLRLLYEYNIKLVVLKRLSDSLSQIRKFLIDEESAIFPQ